MQVDGTRNYRVKDVAEHFDVSVSTIYRAIEAGQLDAVKLGAGQRTLRVPGSAVRAYAEAGVTPVAADDEDRLTPAQADGLACVVCGVDYLQVNAARRPVGWSQSGSQVFACTEHADLAAICAEFGEGPTGREVAAARARVDAARELDAADLNYGQDDLGAVTDLDGVSR